ncbi:DNA replication protein DnaC [Phytobacter ursingii]|nr:DNA replication protein DnaC [Phytobacter ursingii]
MHNPNKFMEREALNNQRNELTEKLAFAAEHKIPWNFGNRSRSEVVGAKCDKHGNYEQFVVIGKDFRGNETRLSSQCPACIQNSIDHVDAQLRSMKVSDLLEKAGVARRFEHCDFDNYKPVNDAAQKNLSTCRRYADSWKERLKAGTGLVFTGSCGTGKNHLAVSITKKIIHDHLARVAITDVMRITRAVKSTWRNNSESTEDDVLDYYIGLDLLIIDEVGVQLGTPSEMTILQEVINARYESVLPTILISNLTFEQLQESIGERIVDRVTDGGSNKLAFNWESYRKQTGANG